MNRIALLLKMAAGEVGTTRQLGVRFRCDPKGLARYMNSLRDEGLVEHFYIHDDWAARSGPMPRSWRVTEKGVAMASEVKKREQS